MLEDDTEFSDLLRIFLESYSYEVPCLTNGIKGLRQIRTTDFDVVVGDLVMPGLSGDMFYLAVERSKPHLCKRFIFLVSHPTQRA